ncbi:MAG: rod shape-determining protein MreC [Rectinema sp.]|nr:rod shape-determining protein MreC [Rectinema sp.]
MKTGGSKGIFSSIHRKAAVLVVSSFIIMAISTNVAASIPSLFKGYVIGTLQKGFSSIGSFFSDTAGAVSELARLRKEYRALLEKLREYEIREREYTSMKEENQRLKELLGIESMSAAEKTIAHIIASDPGNTYSSMVIDKGERDGIERNMPVLAFQNGVEGLAGKITEVRATTSVVQPIHDKRFYAAARLAVTRAEGLLCGSGVRNEPLSLMYIPQKESETLKQGDIVVTSGLDRVFPPEIMIGRVASWKKNEFSGSLLIDVVPAIDLGRTEYVFVIKNAKNLSEGREGVSP